VFDGIKNGNPKTYFYALFDDASGKFGLMNQDGSPKPAGTALHNLTAVMADPGTARPRSLAYGVSGGSGNDNSLLMSKSNGAFLLALWNESDAAHTVTLTLGEAAKTIRLYDPLTGSSASQTAANTNSATVNIPDHPVIVEIVPGGAGVTPPAATPPVAIPPVVTPSVSAQPNVGTGPSGAAQPRAGGPVLIAPETLTTTVSQMVTLSGISIADPWAADHAGALALNLTARTGTIAGTDSAGKPLSGSGTSSIHISGSLATLNSDLSRITYNSATAGADQLTLDVWNQGGVEVRKIIPIAVDP
jgi:hypothetical protein